MDQMEFLHAGRIFTLWFVEDFTFSEVRAVLDDLIARDAFQPHTQETQNPFMVEAEGSSFRIWAFDMQVTIERL